MHLYPDAEARELRLEAAAFFGCRKGQIIAGNGSDEIIDLICRAFLRPGDEVLIPAVTFSYYAIAAGACGAQVRSAPMQDLAIDVEALIRAVGKETRIIFVANPNNPTGTHLSAAQMRYLLQALPAHVLVVVDEAYAAFARAPDFEGALGLLETHPNLIVMNTLSKSHGLAGLRIGFGFMGESLHDLIMRIKPPFNMNLLAITAGRAALADRDFLEATLELTWKGIDQLRRGCAALGLPCGETQTNFALVHLGGRARGVYDALLERGIITRHMPVLEEYLRVSVGLPDENAAFLEHLKEVL